MMNDYLEDKENIDPLQNLKRLSQNKADSKMPRSRSTFGKLLSEANNEIIAEYDEKVALQSHVDEVVDVACELIKEIHDQRIAAELQSQFELQLENEKKRLQKEVKTNEAVALKCAMEERSRLLADAQRKKDIEINDFENCKQIISKEIEEEEKLKSLILADEIMAKEIQDQLQDQLLAEKIQYENDEALAKESEDFHRAQSKQLLEDAKFAKEQQDYYERKSEIDRREMEEKDYRYCKKLSMKAMREEHRRQKRLNWIQNENYQVFLTSKEITKQWREASSDIENVEGGICITLILPCLDDLNVSLKSHKSIRILATRNVKSSDDVDSDSLRYEAEFTAEGTNVELRESDLSYEYSSDSGLLHIYVDGIALRSEVDKSERHVSSSNVLTKVKNTFSRLFGK